MKKKKLVWLIYPTYLLIAFASLLVVTWYLFESLQAHIVSQTQEDLTARTQLVKTHVQSAVITPEKIDRLCKKAGKASGTRITIVLPLGRVLSDSDEHPRGMENHAGRPEIRGALRSGYGSAIRYSETLNKKMMYVAMPVKENGAASLVVRTSLPVKSIFSALGALKTKIATVVLAIALLVTLVSWLVSRKIARPVQEMTQGAQRFASGDLNRRLVLPKSEELADLAAALNDMAAQLDERMKTIKRQKNELETVFSSMTEAVIAVDNDEKILRLNAAAAFYLGGPEASLQGQFLYATIRNHDFTKFVEQAAAAIEKRESDIVFEINDREYIINIKSAALIDEYQERIGTLFVVNDVTRIRQLEKMRKEFAANLSHEIKTPLTSIQGFAEQLKNDPQIAENQEANRYLAIISKNTRRLSAIVEDVMRLSRIEHGDRHKDFSFTETRIKTIIDSAVKICEPEADTRGIRIKMEADPSLTALLDFSLMEQAFVNLLENAVKYSHDNGHVRIYASGEEKHIAVCFEDSGIGIPQTHLPRIFERFYRVDKTRSRELGGTGLGLAIVKHIVQIHGGRTEVDSSPGRGSVFTVILPRNSSIS